MATLADVKAKVRGLVGDPDADWTDDAYILPLINIAYGDCILEIKSASGKSLQRSVVVPNIEAGSTSLIDYQKPKKPLATLTDPLRVWWKPAGSPTGQYREAIPRNTLPPMDQQGQQAVSWTNGLYYRWSSNTLYLTPLAMPVDMSIDGRFDPPELVQDTDIVQGHPNLNVALQYAAAALVGAERPNQNWMTTYGERATASLSNIVADIIKQGQGNSGRAGRINPRESGWYWAR